MSFVDELKQLVDARRSFGGHPLWLRIMWWRFFDGIERALPGSDRPADR